ncbi:MAG TPA: MIP family channel protein, partial [Allocoleopsis sp.]
MNKWINKEILAEFVGTFILIFTGCGAIIVSNISKGAIGVFDICFTFGATVTGIIYSLGPVSGAHLNPAVTLALYTGGFFPKKKVLGYIIAQNLGAIASCIILRLTLGNIAHLGATFPLQDNWIQAFILEIFITFILMFVILGVAVYPNENNNLAGLVIGMTVTLLAVFMGPITGASMNPARSFAPALISNFWPHQWVYIIAPILGAQIA